MFKKSLLSAVLAATSFITLAPTAAHARYTAIVRVAPPPPVQETVPGDRPGFVWAPGHYIWRGNHYAWQRGHWLPERSGYAYREPRWIRRDNGEWFMVGGDWVPRHDRYARRDDDRRYGYDRRDRDERRDQDRNRDGDRAYRDRHSSDPSRY